jgi:hypothetical protein
MVKEGEPPFPVLRPRKDELCAPFDAGLQRTRSARPKSIIASAMSR